jgi:hypothetical protein
MLNLLTALLLILAPQPATARSPLRPQAAPADMQRRVPVLVELFTSEGCSSCPPADKLLTDEVEHQPVPGVQVIGLSEHVDYWDRLGWKDRFSSSEFTWRQERYAERLNIAEPYTPQMVVNGSRQVVGSDDAGLVRAIQAAARQTTAVLTISNVQKRGDSVRFEVVLAAAQSSGALTLFAAVTDDSDVTVVKSGENGGSTLRHSGVVRSLQSFGTIANRQMKTLDIKLPSSPAPEMHLVVFAQGDAQGPVAAVATAAL